MKRLGNGEGSVYKLSGTRRNPWVARKTIGFKMNGQPNYKYIGYYRTKAEAMSALMEYNKAPYSLNGERLCDMYEGFYEKYIEAHSKGAIDNTKTSWKHLAPLYEEPIANLSRKKIQMYFDNLQVSEGVKRRTKMLLKQIMNYSIRYDVIPPEKVAVLDYIDISSKIDTRKVDRQVFTDDEIDKLWSMDDDYARLLLFLIYTGLRAGEYCDITKENIIEGDVIRVCKSKTKSGIRLVPLSDKALKLTSLARCKDYKTLNGRYTTWKKKHGITHKLHDARHTCISRLANAGVDKRVIQAIVGHKGNDVTDDVYTHIDIEVMRDALNKI